MPPVRPGPFRRRASIHGGGQPAPLPLVATVAVTSVQATSASAIGSINPQGLSGFWWFAYGITSALGSTTSPQAASATSIPQTVTVNLTSLTTGTQYWVALVGQTAGGTVTSAPVTFTPASPASTVVSTAVPDVAIPHFAWPFTITPEGANVVEQGSFEEILSCVQTVLACPLGACPELPTFGIPDPTFQGAPPNPRAIVTAVQLWEPRATEDATVQALDTTQADWAITLNTQTAGTGQ